MATDFLPVLSPGPFANIRESRLQNHCVNQSNESRMHDCIGILYSDSEFVDLTPSLILAPPVLYASRDAQPTVTYSLARVIASGSESRLIVSSGQ